MLTGVHDANLYFWNGAYKTTTLMPKESSMLHLFTYPEYFLSKPITRRSSKREWILSLKSSLTGGVTRIMIYILMDVIAFALMVYYFSEVMTDEPMTEFLMKKDEPATTFPDEPEELIIIKDIIVAHMALTTLTYFSINIRAYYLKLPSLIAHPMMLLGLAAAFMFIFFWQFLASDTFKEDRTAEEFADDATNIAGTFVLI